ncbi:putative transmembrane protein [Phytophthora cinnamomi]|uniref:putative transmembrane protein n=1 Tax=Phytophthora cinnamomi TaxID=4785 RepID=UPI00355A4EF0|nr:putative transmembrane protein [Phytophthora cinnamomi]
MFFSQTLLAWEGLSYLENNSLAEFQEEVVSWRGAEDEGMGPIAYIDFQLAASTMLQKTLDDQSLRTGLAFDTEAVSFNISHVALSASIGYDAVTIEIPFDERAIAIADNGSTAAATASVSMSSNSSLLYRLSSITDCGETACLIRPPAGTFSTTASLGDADYSQWNVEPQIQAFAGCVFDDGTEFMTRGYLHGAICTRRSTSSFLVYSFARRVVADDVTVEVSTSTNASRIVTVTNIRRYHTITLGRLSWRTKDLASEFNATCGATGSDACTGISYPLSNPNSSTPSTARHLIVGKDHFPVDSLGNFDGLYSRWTPLAMLTTPTDIQGDLLFKRNVRHDGDDAWQDLDGQCSTSVDVFAAQVEQNRWYMGFGFQESYTAALFLLFQNAVVREEKESVDGSRTLGFAGSGMHVTLEAQIPLPSALISIAGCAVVLAGALCVAISGRRKEVAIQRDVGVEEIAKVMLVDGRFPRLFLDCSLDDPDSRCRRPLHAFHIAALVLHETEPQPQPSNGVNSDINEAGVFIRYPPHA